MKIIYLNVKISDKTSLKQNILLAFELSFYAVSIANMLLSMI